jgi:hypothetical protein
MRTDSVSNERYRDSDNPIDLAKTSIGPCAFVALRGTGPSTIYLCSQMNAVIKPITKPITKATMKVIMASILLLWVAIV